MYTEDNILPVLPIKDLINEDGEPTTPFKLATGTKPSISHLHVLFFPCVVQKATAHIGKKGLNMRHQLQKGFHSTFVGIPQHKKWYLVYVPHKRKIISSYNVFFMRYFLVHWHTRHNNTQKLWPCNCMCHTYHKLNLMLNLCLWIR